MKVLRVILAGAVLAMGIAAAGQKPTEDHVKAMKELGKLAGLLRKGVDVEANANALAAAMKDKVFPTLSAYPTTGDEGLKIAKTSCGDTRKGALAVAKAAAAGDKEGIAAGMKAINAGCKACHDAHRVKLSDTENEIK